MVNKKSLANLKRGNKKNTGRKLGSGGKTWAELIIEHGETSCDLRDKNGAIAYPNQNWKEVVVSAAYRQAALGNAAILRELMQRSEPQDVGVMIHGALPVTAVDYGTAIRSLAPKHDESKDE